MQQLQIGDRIKSSSVPGKSLWHLLTTGHMPQWAVAEATWDKWARDWEYKLEDTRCTQ